ncbi:MAG: SCO family protein [Thioploca sp.]|nr:SCO family protein [Thioploca sp.]
MPQLVLLLILFLVVKIGYAQEDHSAHHAMMHQQSEHYTRSVETYTIPEITLINQEDKEIALLSLLKSSERVALNFIFTTCTTICPVMTATFAKMRQQLGTEADKLLMVSISIDPEQDTPAALQAYAKRYQANPQWQFLTGELEQIIAIQKAFNTYTGNKMNHRPLTFFKQPNQANQWIRIDGLASSADLAKEYRSLLAK